MVGEPGSEYRQVSVGFRKQNDDFILRAGYSKTPALLPYPASAAKSFTMSRSSAGQLDTEEESDISIIFARWHKDLLQYGNT